MISNIDILNIIENGRFFISHIMDDMRYELKSDTFEYFAINYNVYYNISEILIYDAINLFKKWENDNKDKIKYIVQFVSDIYNIRYPINDFAYQKIKPEDFDFDKIIIYNSHKIFSYVLKSDTLSKL